MAAAISVAMPVSISSESVINENTRETRQLSPVNCCPCPTAGRDAFQDQYTASANAVAASTDEDNCPCTSISDSEAASSIFRPAFRTSEPLPRPVLKKEDVNPILKPEVGLASSVLETLQEITDREYQEALARDAARNLLKLKEPELPLSEPRNIFNIILNPKEENSDDVISEASQLQGMNYINPFAYKNNNFERLQSPTKLLKHVFSTAPRLTNNGVLHKSGFDMDGSASNIEGLILPPLKSNILEEIKSKSNLLKLRLFPSTGNMVKGLPINTFKGAIQPDRSDNLNFENIERSKARKSEVSSGNNINKIQNTECTETVIEPNVLGSFNDNLENFDVIPSSSKIVEIERGVIDQPNPVKQDADGTCSEKVLNTNININSNSEKDENDVNAAMEETSNPEIEITTTSSVTTSIITNLKDVDKEHNSSLEDQHEAEATHSIVTLESQWPQAQLSATPTENDLDNLKLQTLPNIKADILKTLENFKMANDIMQKKLRSNVQDALQLVVKKTDSNDELRETPAEPMATDVNNIDTTNNDASVSAQDLQNMSDSLLQLSSKNLDNSSMSNHQIKLKNENTNNPVHVTTTVLNDGHNLLTSEYDKVTLNIKDQSVVNNNSTDANLCDTNIIARNSVSNVTSNEDNEMAAQPSNSIFNRISKVGLNPVNTELLHGDLVFQPKDNTRPTDTVEDYLNNFKSIGTNILKTVKQNYNLYSFEDHNDSSFVTHQQSLFNVNPRDGHIGDSTKFNPYPNLNSYKTKVACPEPLNMNSLLPSQTHTKEDDILGFASQRMPILNVFQRPIDTNKFRTLHADITPKTFENKFSPTSLSESFKYRTYNVLNNLRDSIDSVLTEPFAINKNRLLGGLTKPPEDLNEKLKALQSDLSKRLSSGSLRKSSKSTRLLTPSGIYNSYNRAATGNSINKNAAPIVSQTEPVNLKNILLPKSRQSKEYKNKPILTSILTKTTETPRTTNKASILRPTITQKTETLHNLNNSELKNKPNKQNLPRLIYTLPTKKPLRKTINLKPLKENKITISFSTTSTPPLDTKASLKSKGSFAESPKLSKKIVLKKPILKSAPNTYEPNVLGSENLISRVSAPNTAIGKPKIKQKLVYGADKSHETNYNGGSYENILEANKGKGLMLSKIKDTVFKNASNGSKKLNGNNDILSSNLNNNDFDAAQSASNTIERPNNNYNGEALKENLSYKCKMVCVKDILDTAHA